MYRIKKLYLTFLLLTITSLHGQITNSPWPMFMHDPQHTGRSPFVGPDGPNLAWSINAAQYVAPVIGPNGIIYSYESKQGRLALKPEGTILWNQSGPEIQVVTDDNTLFYSSGNSVYALYPDGTTKWVYRTGGSQGYLTVDAIGRIISDDGIYLTSLSPEGDLNWQFELASNAFIKGPKLCPAVGLDGSIYVRDADGVKAVDPEDGSLKWTYAISVASGRPTNSISVGVDGTIYVGNSTSSSIYNTILYALNPDGTKKWSMVPIESSLYASVQSPAAIGSDGTIYVGQGQSFNDFGYLYAVKADGSLLWTFKAEKGFLGAPTIDANGTVYAVSGIGDLYAFNAASGEVKWEYSLGVPYGSYYATSYPAIDSMGTLYVTTRESSSDKLCAFYRADIGTPDLAISTDSVTFDQPSLTVSANDIIKITLPVEELLGNQSCEFDVFFYLNDTSNKIDSVHAWTLMGSNTTVQGIWNTDSLKETSYNIIIKIENVFPSESNLSNNEIQLDYTFLPLIQERMNNSNPGDTVWVEPGIYYENLLLENGIIVKSRSGPRNTIIDGLQRASVVTVGWSTESEVLPVLDGFTITNGNASSGGGINIPKKNGGSAIITNNIICRNTAIEGAGIYVEWFKEETVIKNNLITENIATGQFGLHGITTRQAECTIINNTIVNNGEADGVGIESRNYPGYSPDIRNCIIWGNGTDLDWFARAYYSNVQNAPISQLLTKCFSTDPQFCDPDSSYYTLTPNSPCINAGDPHGDRDPDGTRADVGAFYYDLSNYVGKIRGIVIDSITGEAIELAKLILSGSNDEDVTLSDKDGKFEFNIREGNDYSLAAYLSNYGSEEIKNITVNVGTTVDLTVKLTPNLGTHYIYSPLNLTAQTDSLEPTFINLKWDSPSHEELFFDDGTFENSYGFIKPGGSFLVGPFGAFDKTVALEKIKMDFEGEKGGDSIRVFVLIDTSNTPENVELEYSLNSEISYSGVFQDYDFSSFNIHLKPGWRFYAGVEQLSYSSMYLKLDKNNPDTLSYYQYDSEPGIFYSWSNGVFAIRAVISYFPPDEDNSNILLSQGLNGTRSFIGMNEINENTDLLSTMRRKKLSTPPPNRYHLHDNSENMGVASVSGFNIYRSLLSPVATIDSNQINNNLINGTSFTDSTITIDGTYHYVVTAVFSDGESVPSNEIIIPVITGVAQADQVSIPTSFKLEHNFPNPFNPTTTIRYQLPKPSKVRLEIYNIIGELIKVVVDENQEAGYYTIQWDGKDDFSNSVASGVYFYTLKTKDFIQSHKLLLIR